MNKPQLGSSSPNQDIIRIEIEKTSWNQGFVVMWWAIVYKQKNCIQPPCGFQRSILASSEWGYPEWGIHQNTSPGCGPLEASLGSPVYDTGATSLGRYGPPSLSNSAKSKAVRTCSCCNRFFRSVAFMALQLISAHQVSQTHQNSQMSPPFSSLSHGFLQVLCLELSVSIPGARCNGHFPIGDQEQNGRVLNWGYPATGRIPSPLLTPRLQSHV